MPDESAKKPGGFIVVKHDRQECAHLDTRLPYSGAVCTCPVQSNNRAAIAGHPHGVGSGLPTGRWTLHPGELRRWNEDNTHGNAKSISSDRQCLLVAFGRPMSYWMPFMLHGPLLGTILAHRGTTFSDIQRHRETLSS